MRLEFIGDPLEKAVTEEIIAWSKDVLEKPSKFFNGLPPCPYAKQAWMKDKVALVFKKEKFIVKEALCKCGKYMKDTTKYKGFGTSFKAENDKNG